jgi:hypothetical protein
MPMTSMLRPLAVVALAVLAPLAQAHDYPTVDRVLYVQSCLRDHPGPAFEMIHKCSCTIDRLADKLTYDRYVELSTEYNATTIGGERGAVIRENEGAQKEIRSYRAMQNEAKKSCFINLEQR